MPRWRRPRRAGRGFRGLGLRLHLRQGTARVAMSKLPVLGQGSTRSRGYVFCVYIYIYTVQCMYMGLRKWRVLQRSSVP